MNSWSKLWKNTFLLSICSMICIKINHFSGGTHTIHILTLSLSKEWRKLKLPTLMMRPEQFLEGQLRTTWVTNLPLSLHFVMHVYTYFLDAVVHLSFRIFHCKMSLFRILCLQGPSGDLMEDPFACILDSPGDVESNNPPGNISTVLKRSELRARRRSHRHHHRRHADDKFAALWMVGSEVQWNTVDVSICLNLPW